MAYRELHVVEVRECLRLWSRGRGFRPIAGHLSLDRKTVRRYVEAAQTFGFERSVGGSDISDRNPGPRRNPIFGHDPPGPVSTSSKTSSRFPCRSSRRFTSATAVATCTINAG